MCSRSLRSFNGTRKKERAALQQPTCTNGWHIPCSASSLLSLWRRDNYDWHWNQLIVVSRIHSYHFPPINFLCTIPFWWWNHVFTRSASFVRASMRAGNATEEFNYVNLPIINNKVNNWRVQTQLMCSTWDLNGIANILRNEMLTCRLANPTRFHLNYFTETLWLPLLRCAVFVSLKLVPSNIYDINMWVQLRYHRYYNYPDTNRRW